MQWLCMARFKLDRAAQAIVLDVTLQGPMKVPQRVRMLLDTGATYTMISWRVAQALGYTPETSQRRMEIVTVSGLEQVPVIVLDTIAALGEEAHNVESLVHDLPPRSYLHGLLGLSFLRHFRLTLDFHQEFIELAPRE